MLRAFLYSIYLLLLWPALPVRAQEYQACFERAMEALAQDSLEQAEACIRQALQAEPANPHNAFLFSNLGTIQRSRGRYEQALDSYTLALNITPFSVPILLNRATLYLEMGKEERARVDYSQVLDVEPDNCEALLRRAYISQQKRDYKSAQADYARLLRLEPLSYEGRLGQATLFRKDGKAAEALALLGAMLEEEHPGERRAVLLVARADMERENAQPELALADLDEAIRLAPGLAEAYLVRGQVHLSRKKKALARRDFESAAAAGIPRSELHDLLSQCR